MSRTTSAAGPTSGLSTSASIPALSSTALTASASSNSLNAVGGAPATRLRSNSNLSARLPTSPTDPRISPSLSSATPQPSQQQQQAHGPSPGSSAAQSTTPPFAPPPSIAPDRNAVVTPPPRPPRGPLRSPGAPRSPSMPSISTELSPTTKLCQRALEHSKDQGDTMDVSREKLERIDDEMVDFFRHRTGKERRGVWRLALSYNALRDGSIVPSFSKLNRLRYLNLKGNELTVVPPALLKLPSLEILDLSKNRIAELPERPGRLASLKVLSLSHNRLTALPTYLADFGNLKVFKVDHNPVQWPPRQVLGPLVDLDPPAPRAASDTLQPDPPPPRQPRSEEDLRPWIEGMRRWLREQATGEDAEQTVKQGRTSTDTEGSTANDDAGRQADGPILSLEQPTPVAAEPTPFGAPTQTMKRVPAASVDEDRAQLSSSPERPMARNLASPDQSLRANTSNLSLPSQAFHHDRSISSSSTPPVSASTASSASGPGALPIAPPAVPSGHQRGASYTATQRLSGTLTAKKSLPDLRQSHAKIIEERRGEATDELRPLGRGIGPSRTVTWQTKPPRQVGDEMPRGLHKVGSMDVLPGRNTPVVANMVDRRDSQDAPAIDESRNSYFRRLSMLPPSTISKQISPAILLFVDSIRGLLFSMTQLHTALRQYLNFAVSDRVAGVFARVLEPASGYLTILINALDRFDSMSRRSAPPVMAIRNVVDAAKESIAVFGKIVSVLRLQTPAFKDADVRYTRLLLLNIYGGMAEIACAWKTMLPLMADIRHLLSPESLRAAPPMSQSNSALGRKPFSPILERGESAERTPGRLNPTSGLTSMPPVGSSPRSKSRRHAGSFSALDVERGMLMGTPTGPQRMEWPAPDTSRTIFEGAENSGAQTLPPFPLHAEPEPPGHHTPPLATSFSQAARSRHIPTSSAGSSYASQANGTGRNLSFDVRPPTPASATLFDEDLLDVMETATDIAFTVWLRLAEDVGASNPPYSHVKSDSLGSTSSGRLGPLTLHDARRPATIPPRQYTELVTWISMAEQVTTTLRESLMGLRANPFSFQHSALPDHAQAFIKTVVKVSGLIKALSSSHTFSIQVRQSLSSLTQSTRECAILMQVSSMRPAQGTPAPSLAPSSSLPSVASMAAGDYSAQHHHAHAHAHTRTQSPVLHFTPSSAQYPSASPYNPSAQSSSNEDLAPPPSSGLRGLHLPARHGLRNGVNGTSGGSATSRHSPMNGSTGSTPALGSVNGVANGHGRGHSGGPTGHSGGASTSGGSAGFSPPMLDHGRFNREALPQRPTAH